jgi:hypothetical protein
VGVMGGLFGHTQSAKAAVRVNGAKPRGRPRKPRERGQGPLAGPRGDELVSCGRREADPVSIGGPRMVTADEARKRPRSAPNWRGRVKIPIS